MVKYPCACFNQINDHLGILYYKKIKILAQLEHNYLYFYGDPPNFGFVGLETDAEKNKISFNKNVCELFKELFGVNKKLFIAVKIQNNVICSLNSDKINDYDCVPHEECCLSGPIYTREQKICTKINDKLVQLGFEQYFCY